jgi:hypothetical protein
MKNRIVVSPIHHGDAILQVARDKSLRFNRGLKAADRVAVCFASNHDAASVVGNCPSDPRVCSHGSLIDLDARSIAGNLDAIAIFAGNDTGSDRVVAAGRSDEDPI